MSKLKDQIEARRREMSVGRGGRLWPRPVPLEPPFIPFDPLRPVDLRNQPHKGWPKVELPEKLALLRVRPSSQDQHSPALAEQLILSLNPSYPVAFEVAGLEGEVQIQLAVATQDAGTVPGQVQAHYPGCEVFPGEDVLDRAAVQFRHARGYRLRHSHLFSLKDGHRAEPYAALVGFLSTLGPGAAALFQTLFIPARRDWPGNILKVARDPYDPGKSAFSNLPQLPKQAQAKVSKPLFAVGLRLAAFSKDILHRLGRLNREAATAIFGNVGTLACLHLGQIDAPLMQRELGEFTAEDLLDLGMGEAVVRMGSARDAFNVRIPLAEQRASHREAVIALSREHYCRPRREVEALLKETPETQPEKEPTQSKVSRKANSANSPTLTELTPDQWRMLEYLADHPGEPVTAVYRVLGFGVGRGARVRQQLVDRGLVVEVEARLGRGNRLARTLVPTVAGLRAVQKPISKGRGGEVHKHFQDTVARLARGLGYEARTERRLESGGSVDVHLSRNGGQIAVEIAVHSRPQREVANVRKCLEAGYARVLALFVDPGLLQETRALFIS